MPPTVYHDPRRPIRDAVRTSALKYAEFLSDETHLSWKNIIRYGLAGVIEAIIFHADVADAAWNEEIPADPFRTDS